jgi:glycerate dehydrogenase
MNHRIVFLDRATLGASLRAPAFQHEYVAYDATTEEEAVERLEGATIAIINKVPLRAGALARLPRLRLIAMAATGSDCVDKQYCREHGIVVSNIRGYADDSVPEHALALMFALRRNLMAYDRDVRAGRWRSAGQFCFFDHPIRDLAGATLGLVGLGAIGKALAARAEALGMRVLATTRSATAMSVDLETLLRRSDVVSLHCPLTPGTHNLIGARELALMKRDAIFINTARGGLVDEAALADALCKGVIAGAGIDVLPEEPPRNGGPLLALDLPNLIVTPHIAWASERAMQRLADQLIDNVEAFVDGHPRNVITE